MIVVAEKLGAFGAQLRNANDDSAIIEITSLAVARERSLHDPLAERPILQRCKHRLPGGVLEADNKFPFLVLVFGGGRCRSDIAVR